MMSIYKVGFGLLWILIIPMESACILESAKRLVMQCYLCRGDVAMTKQAKKETKLKTFIITDQFEDDMKFLRDFYTTDAKIIREAVKLLAMVRTGSVQVTNRT
jgi:hypothetical protein